MHYDSESNITLDNPLVVCPYYPFQFTFSLIQMERT
jgi:hypothetical protein